MKPEKANYPKKISISDSLGIPKDTIAYYLPFSIQNDSTFFNIKVDTSNLDAVSGCLISAKEPILFNYYLGHDIYRLIWFNSLSRKPIIITLNKVNDSIWLTTKVLDHCPDLFRRHKSTVFIPKSESNGDTVYVGTPIITVAELLPGANIEYNKTIRISSEEWNKFIKLLDEGSFWKTKPSLENIPPAIDGAIWLIEAHTKHQYWFVLQRWDTYDSSSKAVSYLLNLSQYKVRN